MIIIIMIINHHNHEYYHHRNDNHENDIEGPYVRTEGVRPEQEGDAIRYDVLSVAKEVKLSSSSSA